MKTDINKMRQIFCRHCAGLRKFYYDGKRIMAKNWMDYDMANDIGCICPDFPEKPEK